MLHTLGGLHLEGAAHQQAGPLLLLGYLALEGPRERRSVQELFFPGHADAAGRLRMTLHRLKKAAPQALDTSGTRLQTSLPSDVAGLLQAAEEGESARVLALYRGRFLDGVRLPGGQELEEWVFATRERLTARVRTSHLTLGRAAAVRGETGLGLTHAEQAYLLPGSPEPGRDEARLLALLLTAVGSAFAADARSETREAHALPDQAGEALTALRGPGRADAPDPITDRPTHIDSTENGGLPDPLPTLLGREEVLAQIAACFGGGARLVTLLGQGGMGKTLLARHVLQRASSRHAARTRDQVSAASPAGLPFPLSPGLLVDLSAVQDEAGVLPAIATAVQARNASLPDVAMAASGHDLLVLDNFEQVVGAAPQIARLLALAPDLRLLVTSRERLHLSQEHVLLLPGLALQGAVSERHPTRLGSALPAAPFRQSGWSDAARLFVRRATRAHLGFVPDNHRAGIELVCTLLRGVPLLIELASAWVRTLPPADIAAQLDEGRLRGADLSAPDLNLLETRDRNVLPRHASARAVLEASWKRLSPGDQAQLSRLSVFLSDFTLSAARQVTGATLSRLANLTDKSWLGSSRPGPDAPGRLSWHPMARAFVREMAGDWPGDGWKDLLPAHARFFANGLNADRFQAEHLAELLDEWPDIGQAVRTLARLPEGWPTLVHLAREVPAWTDQVGNYVSVAGLIGRVLDALPAGAAPRAQVLRARAFMFVRMNRPQEAAADFREADDLLPETDETEGLTEPVPVRRARLHCPAGEHEA